MNTQANALFSQGDFQRWAAEQRAHVEQALDQWVQADVPAGLGVAMRYAVLDGGKRLRPLLVLAAAQSAGGTTATPCEGTLRAACAVELIHAYSLVHDDLPCMDNDVLRRGKPTAHVQFGEAQALLAGDALQALAFELLVPDDGSLSAAQSVQLCRLLSVAAGGLGMAGGQAIDLAGVGQTLSQPALEDMHRRKTGALLLASVSMGAATVRMPPAALSALEDYGRALGLAFQVMDDILDVTADSVTLGKTAGKDAAADKPTFVSLMGLEPARGYANTLLAQAHSALERSALPSRGPLHAIADWVVGRTH